MIRYVLAATLSLSPVCAQEQELPSEGLAFLAKKVLGNNGGNRLFYFPTKSAPHDPSRWGLKFEDVTFKSEDGTKLHGWFLKPPAGILAKGTIVFSHGNAGAVGHHIGFVAWMVKAGYKVLLYDYRGYGKSEGEIQRNGMLQDVRGALGYVATRKDVDHNRLISFGHSLGGAKSLAAIGQKNVAGLRAVISFAGFASYQDMARWVAGDVGGELVTDELSARDLVSRISPVPLLILHGTRDGTVPVGQAELLFKNAGQPKTLFKIEHGGHNDALAMNDGEYQKKILKWLDEVVR
jgi:uncharacterized protein